MTETRDKIVIESTTQGVDQSTDKLKGLAKAYDGVSVASEKTEKSTVSVENKFTGLERRFGTVSGHAAQLAKVQKDVNLAVAQNPALQERANAILQAAEQRYAGVGKSAGLARHELINLSRQAQDVGVSLFSGQSPLTVLAQQGSQIADVFASSRGSVGGFFRQVASGAAALITPTNAAIAGTVALTAATAALANAYDKVQVSSQRALIGAGARTGTSVGDLNKFTDQNSGLAGTGLSSKEARSLGEDFTKTGEIVISRLKGMSDAVVGFSNQTGQSMSEASKAMVGFATDPRKALEELSKTYGDFDVATRKAVDALVLADDKTGAFQVVIDALGEKSKQAAENMGFLEKAGRAVVNALATETVKPSGLEDQLAAAEKNLSAGGAARSAGTWARLRKEIEDLQQAIEKVNAQKAAAEIDRLSNAADGAARSITPQIEQIKNLEMALGQLERARAAGTASKYGADVDNAAATAIQNQIEALKQSQAEAARYNQQVQAISKSYQGVSQSTALALNAARNQLPVIQAITGAQRMAAQYAADYANALAAGKAPADALALSASNLAASQAAANTSVMQQVESLKDSTAMIKAQQNGTEASTAAAIAYKNAIASGADETAAAALRAETLANHMAQSAQSAQAFANSVNQISNGLQIAGGTPYQSGNGGWMDGWNSATGGTFDPEIMGGGGSFAAYHNINVSYKNGGRGFNIDAGQLLNAVQGVQAQLNDPGQVLSKALASGGVDGALAALKKLPNSGAQVSSLYDLKLAMAGDNNAAKAGIYGEELSYLQSQPQTVENMRKIVDLQNSIDQLKNSTDGLNSTNQDLLSPYYTQDPRTSHIGFRSQGMATGGYVDVPGGISANDNMMAMIPVASGERIFVDPQSSKRGVGGGSTTINISAPITIGGNANADEVGRTVYQAMQSAGRQLQAAQR
jgi:hypothetical protein